MLRTHLIGLPVLFLVLGCGLGLGDDPEDLIFFPDDDDDSAQDDDDGGDDDDFTNPDTTSRSGIVWLLERRDLASSGEPEDRLLAAGSFAAVEPAAMPDLLGYRGLPLPGLSLHPDLDPGFEDGEGCEPIASSDGREPLADSDDVGGAIFLNSSDDQHQLEIGLVEGSYRFEDGGGLPSDSWDLTIDGSATWPGSSTADVLSAPKQLEDVLPTPGLLNSLSAAHVGWTPGEDEHIEILMVRFASTVDEDNWTGIRCRALDDGTYTVDASALASAGSGEIQVSISRAHWQTLDAEPSEGQPHLHAGLIRALWFRVTPGGT